MVWTFAPRRDAADRVVLDARRDGHPVGRAAFFDALGAEEALRAALTDVLARARFDAFAWETAPLSEAARDRPFAMAVVDSPGLRRAAPDPAPFRAHLGGQRVATFANLGGDAVLVAPSPEAAPGAAHLARFVRDAPPEVIDTLWRSVAVAVGAWPPSRTVWVSTAGLGVSWLHVRLDAEPKYYRHAAFASPSA